MRINESMFRRILREEARRVLGEQNKFADVSKMAQDKFADVEKLGSEVGEMMGGEGSTEALMGGEGSTEALLGGEAATLSGGAETAAAASGATTVAAVLGAAILGLAVGTLINKGLNKAGINDAVINWILAQRASKVGYDFEAWLDLVVISGNLDKATGKLTAAGAAGSLRPMSFTLTGVRGTLIDPKTLKVINNNSFHGFTGVAPCPVDRVCKARMPKKPEGLFVPAQLIGQVTYEGGAVVSLVSREGSLVTVPGTSTIKGTLISSKKLGT